ncbi:Rhomboid protease AarA [Kordia antarctica]|uniref:Rhomboid protease AarA n=1 Tax=Kordia antarctica TaxID=1218801 RepID=A0A7L4ZSB6_9FLAO|nr:rhomboid family intramembrane serine protease [Kordia antarctica]QHI39006.1 Rhomboid protease AarA [Kordia antarctica]
MMRITETVKHLIIINVLLWLTTVILGMKANIDLNNILALHFPENESFGFWQPITSMFMHSVASPAHLLFNMIGLWMFGSALEERWGKIKFLSFYMITGVGAGLVHTLVNYYGVYSNIGVLVEAGFNQTEILSVLKEGKYIISWESLLTPSQFTQLMSSFNSHAVGASGALYGVLVAFGMLYPNMELMMMFIPIPIKAKYFIPGLLVIDFIGGITGGLSLFGGGNIAHFAHLGGALFGFLLMLYFNKTQFNKNRWN